MIPKNVLPKMLRFGTLLLFKITFQNMHKGRLFGKKMLKLFYKQFKILFQKWELLNFFRVIMEQNLKISF